MKEIPNEKVLCVVTAVWRPRHEWLRALGDSLATISLPDNWRLIWAAQEDGEPTEAEGVVGEYPFARYGCLGVHRGVAVTRNSALARVPEATAVVNFDCDDVAGHGLRRSLELLDANHRAAWVAGRVDDLLDTGETVSIFPFLAGDVGASVVPALWWKDQRLPLHTVGLVARADEWRAIGGWGAVPSMSDDTAALMTLTALWPGEVHTEMTGLWRRHEGQHSMAVRSREPGVHAWEIIHQRVEALGRIGRRFTSALEGSAR